MDEHIRQIANHFDVTINRHGECFQVLGQNSLLAIESLKFFYNQSCRGNLAIEDVQLGLAAGGQQAQDNSTVIHSRRGDISGRTINQNKYIQAILTNDITFGIGPAGTGKTYLAVACAID